MKVYILLADGFEEIETVSPIDVLRRAGAEVSVLAVGDNLTATGAHGLTITADSFLKDEFENLADMVILPGGGEGAVTLKNSTVVHEFLQRHAKANKYIAAICAAPIALDAAGVLEGHAYTCYPGCEQQIKSGEYHNDRIVIDNLLITAKGPAIALDFAYVTCEVLFGKEVVTELKTAMIANL